MGHNILFLASWYPEMNDPVKGLFVRKHAIEISKKNVLSVLYFDFNGDKDIGLYKKSEAVTGSQLKETTYSFPVSKSFFRKILNVFLMNVFLLKYLSKGKFDLIHLNVVYPVGVLLFPVLRLSRLPLVITEHWSGYFPQDNRYFQLNGIVKNVISALFRKARVVTAVSDVLKKRISEEFGVAGKSVVVPNVIQLPLKVKGSSKFDDRITVLSVCTFDDHAKNISGMIHAVEAAGRVYPELRLVLVGDGPDFRKIRDLADSKGLLNGRVIFTGYLNKDEIENWYEKANFYLMNSNFETFSISTAEALLRGLPVVATRCMGPEEYIDDSVGILIEPGNHDELVSALLKMTEDYSKYEPLKIQDQVKSRLSVGLVDQAFEAVYNSLKLR